MLLHSSPCRGGTATKTVRKLTLDAEMIEKYHALKPALLKALKEDGHDAFTRRSSSSSSRFVGLVNQGATCYLNSLLQALFFTSSFRKRIYEWKYDRKRDGDEELCVLLQLQRLFVLLQTTTSTAISTKSLTKAFGWTAAESFRQHDVQELCRVLFDNIELGIGTSSNNPIEELFAGEVTNYLKSKCGKYSRERVEKFLDVVINVRGSKTVEESLTQYVTPDELVDKNKWEAEDGVKVDALKGVRFKNLPPVLMLHLKRFVFNLMTLRREKVSDDFIFKESLDMTPFLEKTSTSENSLKNIYELFAVLIHHGTAMGGHYFAYIKDPFTAEWYCFNDSTVTKVDVSEVNAMFSRNISEGKEKENPMTQEDENRSMHQKNLMKVMEEAKFSSSISSHSNDSTATKNAYLLLYSRNNEKEEKHDFAHLPSHLADWAANIARKRKELIDAYTVHREMVEIRIFYTPSEDFTNDDDAVVELHQGCTIRCALEQACKTILLHRPDYTEEVVDSLLRDDRVRLRKYDPISRGRYEIYDELDEALSTLSIIGQTTMLLEMRDKKEEWKKYNPNEQLIEIVHWDFGINKISNSGGTIVSVEGDQYATVESLKHSVESAFGVPPEKQRLILLRKNQNAVILRSTPQGGNEALQLVKDYNIWSGSQIVLEVMEDKNEDEFDSKLSKVIIAFEESRNTVTIRCNTIESPDDFTIPIVIDLRKSVKDLRNLIGTALKIDPNEIHLRRSAYSSMMKDSNHNLRDLRGGAITEGSVIFVGKGKTLNEGEY
eukprot:g4371.t1